ncbi:hypothetical protein GCM10020001_008030 [Nonomuraea salmonea]
MLTVPTETRASCATSLMFVVAIDPHEAVLLKVRVRPLGARLTRRTGGRRDPVSSGGPQNAVHRELGSS